VLWEDEVLTTEELELELETDEELEAVTEVDEEELKELLADELLLV